MVSFYSNKKTFHFQIFRGYIFLQILNQDQPASNTICSLQICKKLSFETKLSLPTSFKYITLEILNLENKFFGSSCNYQSNFSLKMYHLNFQRCRYLTHSLFSQFQFTTKLTQKEEQTKVLTTGCKNDNTKNILMKPN